MNRKVLQMVNRTTGFGTLALACLMGSGLWKWRAVAFDFHPLTHGPWVLYGLVGVCALLAAAALAQLVRGVPKHRGEGGVLAGTVLFIGANALSFVLLLLLCFLFPAGRITEKVALSDGLELPAEVKHARLSEGKLYCWSDRELTCYEGSKQLWKAASEPGRTYHFPVREGALLWTDGTSCGALKAENGQPWWRRADVRAILWNGPEPWVLGVTPRSLFHPIPSVQVQKMDPTSDRPMRGFSLPGTAPFPEHATMVADTLVVSDGKRTEAYSTDIRARLLWTLETPVCGLHPAGELVAVAQEGRGVAFYKPQDGSLVRSLPREGLVGMGEQTALFQGFVNVGLQDGKERWKVSATRALPAGTDRWVLIEGAPAAGKPGDRRWTRRSVIQELPTLSYRVNDGAPTPLPGVLEVLDAADASTLLVRTASQAPDRTGLRAVWDR